MGARAVTTRNITWAGALLVVACGAAACGPGPTLADGDLDPIRVAVVTSLQGGLETDGPGWRDAARLAAAEINAAGGPLPGRSIEVVVFDDETNPERGPAIGRAIVEDEQGFVAVVGAAASSITIGVATETVPAQIPQISCCSTSNLITENARALPAEERFLFRTSPSDALQSRVVALAADELACTALAILHLDDDYGMPFGVGIEEAYEQSGGTVVARVPFTGERTSYTAELTQVRDAAPDCIALVAFPVSAGVILRDWDALSGAPDVTWIGTDGIRAPGFIDEAGESRLVEGFFGTSPITDPATPEYNEFRERYRDVFGAAPIPFSANQYDAMALVGLAIARAGTTDGPAVRDAIREVSSPPSDRGTVSAGDLGDALAAVVQGRDVDYQGASGNTDFDENHDVRTPYEIWRYDGPSTTPCASSTPLGGGRGSFCRFRTFNATEIE